MNSVVINNLDPPGTFSVTNHGPDIRLLRRVEVQQHESQGWAGIDADVRLVASCEEVETGDSRLLKHGETLNVKSWNGWSSDGQCPRPSRANIYYGPGTFRFVVVSEQDGKRFEGPPFELGPEPK